MENTLNGNIIIKAVKKLERKPFNEIQYDAEKIKYEKYQNKKIGTFIKNNFVNAKRKYEADSGTLFCKLDFCKAAVESMNNTNDLSEAGKTIVERLFKFIENSNQY